MKRLILFTLIFALTFCGCENKKSDERITGNKSTVNEQSNVSNGKINCEAFEDLSLSAEKCVSLYGEPEETEWAEGPIYKFANSGKWYSFSQYEFDGNVYFPKGECTEIIMPLYEIIKSENGEYDLDTVKEATGNKLVLSYNEIDNLPNYETVFKKFKLVIYAEENGNINENSNVNVALKEE